jgi:RNA polymerase sigma factor (sigma-70 family)
MADTQLGALLHHVRQLAAAAKADGRSDRELLAAFQTQGDEAAFAAVVQRYSGLVLRVCRHVLGHEQDAEDAFQATFLALARSARSVRKGASLASWLYGVALRTAMNARRAAARRRIREGRFPVIPPEPPPPAQAAWREVQQALDEEITRLPEHYRAPFILCCLEGRSRAEVAGALGLRVGTVWSRLAKARKRLQERLAQRGIELSAVLAAAAVTEGVGRASGPARLIGPTIETALRYAAGPAASKGIPSRLFELAEGVRRNMVITRLKFATMMLMTTTLVIAGMGTLAYRVLTAQETIGQPSQSRSSSGAEVADVPMPGAHHRIIQTPLAVWTGHGQDVACGAIAPNGKTLVSGSWDGTITIWDAAKGQERKSLPGFAPRLQAVAINPTNETFATATDDLVVRIWDMATGKPRAALHGPAGEIMALAYSPDGKSLASAGGNQHRAGELKLWDVAAGKERILVEPFKEKLYGLAYAPDGKRVAVAGGDGTAQIVDTASAEVVACWRHPSYVRRVAFSPDGKWLAVTYDDEGYVRIYEVEGAKLRSAFQAPGKRVFGLEFAPDGKRLLTPCGDGTAVIWDVSQPSVRPLTTLKGPPQWLWFAAFFPDGRTVATGGQDKKIRLWRVGDRK